MKIWKKAVSAFLAAVTAVTMLFAGSVTASAAKSPYSVGYYPSFVFEGIDGIHEALMFNGLTMEEFAYYTSVINSGTGSFVVSIYLNDETYFDAKVDATNTYVRSSSEKALTDIRFIYTSTGVSVVFFLNQDTLSDETRRLMRNITTCSAGIVVEIDGTEINYQNVNGYNDTDFYVVGDSTTNNSSSKSVSSLSATVKNQTYTGKALTPDVTVKDGNMILKKGTDYTLTYKNNKAIGTAFVTIKGKGDYSGEQTLTFQIVPKKTTLTAKKSGEKIKLSWKKADGAEKYVIYYREKGESKYKKLATVSGSKTSYSTSKLDKSKTYQFKIRSYAESNGKKYYSSYSKVVTTK